MSFIAADWSIDRYTKNIRYRGDDHTGATPSYATVIEFHRALQTLAEQPKCSGNDGLDITEPEPSNRLNDTIITLINGWNIDDTAAEHLYDGSIIQKNGDEVYDGISVFANAGTHLSIIQDGSPISPNFWTTGLNADSSNGISHRFMLKVRTGGNDIDGRRLLVEAGEFGNSYSDFRINGTIRGINTAFLSRPPSVR